jgi:hypothetical protein
MTMIWGTIRNGLMALGLAAFALGGCAPGDVELNGKIFDAVGLSGGQKTGSIPKVAERAPLVVPPSLQRLPEPGSVPPVTDANFPVNPEQTVDQKQAKLVAEHKAYCKENYEKQLALGNRTAAETAIGPLGRCQASALSVLGKNPLEGLEKK